MKVKIIIGLWVWIGIACQQKEVQPPNILFAIADDASWAHMGAYGCDWVKTPGFDRVAKEGLLFMNAYTPNAKCAPSRACILTARNTWQLEEACNHSPAFPKQFASYMEVLGKHGYNTGFTGKGWGPGDAGEIDGKPRLLTGPVFKSKTTKPPTSMMSGTDYAENFDDFLQATSSEKPWCFWYGGHEPHRKYEYGSSISKGGKKLEDIDKVPDFWPDTDSVRTDMLDYAYEIEYFDQHLVKMIDRLDSLGQLDNTIIVVTADNGMPFPRIKGQEYEYSNHLPLAIMWPNGIKKPGRKVEDLVSFIDLAPTFLEAAGVAWSTSGMSESPGKSLITIFSQSVNEVFRDFVVFGKERHDVGRPQDQGYPIRGITKDGYLFVKNYEPNRWPVGNPETGYLNTDGGATKTFILNMRRNRVDSGYWQMNFGKRPVEELYNIKKDPFCMDNLTDNGDYVHVKHALKEHLFATLREEGDPRVFGQSDYFEKMPYNGAVQGMYERFMSGEKINTGWVNDSDYETEMILDEQLERAK
ncbi:sulfatase [Reichenbachiella carrageenanivorans]|uniref:Sulfatase n=1 Tax=Reichenbachiella carrageenanivorans TaxID=2979869 RepID=A0ABY6D487_9BACT|nr:sulfatase [Reichenbachiella carrageenanivorans]UXX80967.1 sulfatase [Reichenbachiella carrageenanivorans]